MTVLYAVLIAFSTYSVIPVPQVHMKKETLPYAISAYPLVGALIGALLYGWLHLCGWLAVPSLLQTCVAMLLPILVTGGIHADGFMDTMDALCSYGSTERRQEILKDPHVGAFAVIWLGAYGLLYMGFASVLDTGDGLLWAGSFVLSRCLCGVSVLTFPPAKKEGMLYAFASGPARRRAAGISVAASSVCGAFLLWQDIRIGVGIILAQILLYLCYRRMVLRKFGGISGDLAGWFVCMSELCSVIVIGAVRVCF